MIIFIYIQIHYLEIRLYFNNYSINNNNKPNNKNKDKYNNLFGKNEKIKTRIYTKLIRLFEFWMIFFFSPKRYIDKATHSCSSFYVA